MRGACRASSLFRSHALRLTRFTRCNIDPRDRRSACAAADGKMTSPPSSRPTDKPPPPPPPTLPFDGDSRRRGLLHPASQVAVDPSPHPPPGEAPPSYFSVGSASKRRCARCGGPLSVAWLEGRWRQACRGGGDGEEGSAEGGCGEIAYRNPLVVVGTIVTHEEGGEGESGGRGEGGGEERKRNKPKVLLVKRAIEPRKGCWSLPAGYLELGESTAAGAARETWEEARARVEVVAPFFHADVPAIGQSYLLFRGRLETSSSPPFSAGPESEDVALFDLEDVPKLDLAFSAVATALRLFAEDVEGGCFHYHHGTIVKKPGEAPNAGELVDHFALRIS